MPGFARILGDARSFKSSVSETIEREMKIITRGIADSFNVTADVLYTREFIPLINDPALTNEVLEAARSFLPNENILLADEPVTSSEDFAHYLSHVPGCFLNLGNGEQSAPLHNPNYDFNDDGLIHGVNTHIAIVERRLPVQD